MNNYSFSLIRKLNYDNACKIPRGYALDASDDIS